MGPAGTGSAGSVEATRGASSPPCTPSAGSDSFTRFAAGADAPGLCKEPSAGASVSCTTVVMDTTGFSPGAAVAVEVVVTVAAAGGSDICKQHAQQSLSLVVGTKPL